MICKICNKRRHEKIYGKISECGRRTFPRRRRDLNFHQSESGLISETGTRERMKIMSNAITKFVESGGNVIDTAANYRFQRSERNIGKALKNYSKKIFRAKKF